MSWQPRRSKELIAQPFSDYSNSSLLLLPGATAAQSTAGATPLLCLRRVYAPVLLSLKLRHETECELPGWTIHSTVIHSLEDCEFFLAWLSKDYGNEGANTACTFEEASHWTNGLMKEGCPRALYRTKKSEATRPICINLLDDPDTEHIDHTLARSMESSCFWVHWPL